LNLTLSAAAVNAAEARRAPAGALGDGTKIELITWSDAHGVSARILTYGAMLGHDTLASHSTSRACNCTPGTFSMGHSSVSMATCTGWGTALRSNRRNFRTRRTSPDLSQRALTPASLAVT
jgi:hypothetical protein